MTSGFEKYIQNGGLFLINNMSNNENSRSKMAANIFIDVTEWPGAFEVANSD